MKCSTVSFVDKKNNDNMRLAKCHFDKLKGALEAEGELKNYILIIEYLINFLGCLTLAALKNKAFDASRNDNISDLTAGQWAYSIEKWTACYSDEKKLKALRLISAEFISTEDNTPRIKSYIRKWIELRNTLSHDIIIIDSPTLDKLLKRNLFSPKDSLDAFINSVLKIIEAHSDLAKADFFHSKDNSLYVYAGLDRESVKYRHYSAEPVIVTKTDFPLSYKEIFLSLAPTALDNLWEADEVKIKMTTMRSRLYENNVQLWVNGRLVNESFCRFSDGEFITYPLKGFPFEEGGNNLIEVKALRYGKIQASDEKLVRIHSLIPDIEIRWEGRELQEIPTDKLYAARFAIQSVFGITDVHVDVMDEDGAVLDQNPAVASVNTKKYAGTINILSTHIGETEILTRASYTDRNGDKKTKTTVLKVRFTPNFFEPNFEGAGRNSLIHEMLYQKGSWLITGEGGIGKSRLVSEFLKKASRNHHEITITPAQQLTEQLASVFKMHFDKRDKGDDRRAKIITWFQENGCLPNEALFWIKDCHEIASEEERNLLKGIAGLCCQSGSTISLIIESRDESWGENARKVIKELQTTDIALRALNRLERDNLAKVIDSVFSPNNFSAELKNVLIDRCDGIIYMLLEFLKRLYSSDYIQLDKSDIWTVREDLDLERKLGNLNFSNVLKVGLDECMKTLDANGLGEKARDLLRYLSFRGVHKDVLDRLLAVEPRSFHFILEVLESNYVIKKHGDLYEYHHQIKRDYCAQKFLLPELVDDYFIELDMAIFELNRGNDEILDDEEIGDGIIWGTRCLRLHDPKLLEKINWVIHMYCNIDADVYAVIKNYINILPKERILDYMLKAINADIVDHGEWRNYYCHNEAEIELIRKTKGIDELDQQFLELKAIFELNRLSDMLYSDYKGLTQEHCSQLNLTNISGHISNKLKFLSCNLPHLTSTLFDDLDFLNDIYNRLDMACMYFDLASIELHDACFPMIHICSVLVMTQPSEKEKYMDRYLTLVKSFFNMSNIPSDKLFKIFYSFHFMPLVADGWKKGGDAYLEDFFGRINDVSVRGKILDATESYTVFMHEHFKDEESKFYLSIAEMVRQYLKATY